MKTAFLRFALLGLLAAGCSKGSDPTPAKSNDPFLGHWVASEARVVTYSSTGQVSHDDVDAGTYTVDITANQFTVTKTNAQGTGTDTQSYTYARSGETLTLSPTNAQIEYYARNVTNTGWTYESLGRYATGSTRTTITYHR